MHRNARLRSFSAASTVLWLIALLPPFLVLTVDSETEWWLLIAAQWVLCWGYLAVNSRSRDFANPILWLLAAMLFMFAIHPGVRIIDGSVYAPYRGLYDITDGLSMALLAGCVATGTVVVSSAVASLVQSPKLVQVKGRSDKVNLKRFRSFGRLFFAVGLFAYILVRVRTGTNPFSGSQSTATSGAAADSAYLYLAPQLLGPAALCYLMHALGNRRPPYAAFGLVALQVCLYVPLGSRMTLLATAVPVVFAYFMVSGRKMKPIVAVVGLVLAFALLSLTRDLGANSTVTAAESGAAILADPLGALEALATGPDSEMVDGLALATEVVPDRMPFQPGHTIYTVVSQPIPSAIWAGKPQTADGYLNEHLFGIARNNAGVAYSWVGELYFDFGLYGVVLGFASLTIALGALHRRYRSMSLGAPWTLAMATVPAQAVILSRGSLALSLAAALFSVVPVIVAIYFSTRGGRCRASRNVDANASGV